MEIWKKKESVSSDLKYIVSHNKKNVLQCL